MTRSALVKVLNESGYDVSKRWRNWMMDRSEIETDMDERIRRAYRSSKQTFASDHLWTALLKLSEAP